MTPFIAHCIVDPNLKIAFGRLKQHSFSSFSWSQLATIAVVIIEAQALA
jgi:hypothetical protein